jgi:DNA replication protein DnaC
MESINNKLQQLAKRLNLTDENQDPEPYILTKEEEYRLIEHEIKSAKEYAKWKMQQLAMTKEQIDFKILEINWEERIDRNEIFQRANSIKNHELWIKEKRIKDKEEEEKKAKELQEHWTAKRIYNLMAWTSQSIYNKKLIVNDDNKKLISALCFFVSNDNRFETELNYSFNKGLLVRGISGIGKTHLVSCIEKNGINPIAILSMIEITDDLKSYGEYEINKGTNKIIYLDDVGTEETPIVHFGTKINFFKNFIESIYFRNKNSGFGNLILSTNLSFQQISDKYGFRVASRMRDMFNVIDVSGKDMRGNG